MSPVSRTLTLLPEVFAICRLEPDSPIPDWAMPRQASFFTIARTKDELSVICPQQHVPAGVAAYTGWRCLKLEGDLDVNETGVLAALVMPLAQAGIGVFAEATYERDYLLVKQIEKAIEALEQMNHRILQ
jgi:hypothetical protein